jgi:hypothetical protein
MSAAFEHFWTPALRTSIYGSYIDVSHNATANFMMCTSALGVAPVPAGFRCNMDFQAWNIGSRTQWEPVRGLIMGVDVIYNRLETATFKNPAGNFVGAGAILANSPGVKSNSDADSWTGTFRIQRDFVP